MRWVAIWMMSALAASAEGERAGDFDYYVLSLSWTPNWCAEEGDARGSDQCEAGADVGWSLHGLWPQNERGWPSYCRTSEREASRSETGSMSDLMGASGLAWHQWKKHGRCSGLSARAYFDAARAAYDSVRRPQAFRALTKDVTLPASLIEDAFLDANPQLRADGLTVTCKGGAIQEVRVCLTKELQPRRCGADVIRDCTARSARFAPVR